MLIKNNIKVVLAHASKKSAHERVKIQLCGNTLSFFKNVEAALSFYNFCFYIKGS